MFICPVSLGGAFCFSRQNWKQRCQGEMLAFVSSVDMNTIRILHSSLLPHEKGVLLLQFTISILSYCGYVWLFHAEPFLWSFAVFQHLLEHKIIYPQKWLMLLQLLSWWSLAWHKAVWSDCVTAATILLPSEMVWKGTARCSLGNTRTFKNTWE